MPKPGGAALSTPGDTGAKGDLVNMLPARGNGSRPRRRPGIQVGLAAPQDRSSPRCSCDSPGL